MKDTKEKIIDAAVVCLNNSITATIDDIASYIGINRRTIHRYFTDRESLIECCQDKMLRKCNQAMVEAYNSSDDALQQVENMFYAAFSIGTEFSFVKNLAARSAYSEVVNSEAQAYDNVKDKWFKLIDQLQHKGVISRDIPLPWIYNLFGGMIDIAIAARESGDVAVNDLKRLSWMAFKGSIGIAN